MAIQVLDQNTINKIAAGEVIERPSSVVKELVENAIDAKATAITVEIKDGGISFIRVTDNGCGITIKELPLAFLRHSTSKIRSVEDLLRVSSLGFRGEALSSIAAVAQVELISKTKSAFSGARYVVEGGTEVSLEEIGAPEGTTMIVRNLFYNTPVRRKFLKTAMTEAGYVNALVEHLALSHPEISFRFISNNQNRLHTSGNGNLKEIVYGISGRDIAANLIVVEKKSQDIEVAGFIGKPQVSRGNRALENYFINGRYIKSSVITKAVEEAYKGFIMAHMYPYLALHFQMNPTLMDVNVHPAKMELRFSQNEYVYNVAYDAVRNALESMELVSEVSFSASAADKLVGNKDTTTVQPTTVQPTTVQPSKPASVAKMPAVQSSVRLPEPFEVNREKQEEQQRKSASTGDSRMLREATPAYGSSTNDSTVNDSTVNDSTVNDSTVNDSTVNDSTVNDSTVNDNTVNDSTVNDNPGDGMRNRSQAQQMSLFGGDTDTPPAYRLVGQLFDTYWVIEYQDKMYLMDQHAAHEKILYEKTMKLLEQNQMMTQSVLPPIVLSLSMQEENMLREHLDSFVKLGFEIEDFGGREYKITGIPASLPLPDNKALFIELLDGLADNSLGKKPQIITEKIASMSCKAAVKGNMQMSFAEAKNLVDMLLKADNPYHCPHGRPTLIAMSKYEIEKKFKRIV